jgi:hypothetical protein
MNNMELMFGKKKNGARRLPKEAASSRSRSVRKAKAASRTQEFFRLMSLGLSSPKAPVLRRFHD